MLYSDKLLVDLGAVFSRGSPFGKLRATVKFSLQKLYVYKSKTDLSCAF